MRVFCAIIAALVLTLAPGPSRAQDQSVLIVALSSLPPWKMVLDTGPAGIDVDILREAAARMNVGLEFRNGEFRDCLKWMKTGQVDIMTGLLMVPEREDFLTYVTPPYSTRTTSAFYALKKRAPQIDHYENLRYVRVGVKRGEKHFPQFDIDPEVRKTQVASLAEGFDKLIHEHYGTFIANELQADWWLAEHTATARLVAKAPLKYQGYQDMYFAFSNQSAHAERADQLGKTLVAMIQDGTIDAILDRYAIGRE